ncbi:hypothetical protein [Acidimicrobium ferrooxidans]|nr:hypothetical protein [Acidimicrobium ferrooxidans]
MARSDASRARARCVITFWVVICVVACGITLSITATGPARNP